MFYVNRLRNVNQNRLLFKERSDKLEAGWISSGLQIGWNVRTDSTDEVQPYTLARENELPVSVYHPEGPRG
jgi:hypothetical protein